nr:MAG TPA: hypothetical protein [Caudoviricetes sp.]
MGIRRITSEYIKNTLSRQSGKDYSPVFYVGLQVWIQDLVPIGGDCTVSQLREDYGKGRWAGCQ